MSKIYFLRDFTFSWRSYQSLFRACLPPPTITISRENIFQFWMLLSFFHALFGQVFKYRPQNENYYDPTIQSSILESKSFVHAKSVNNSNGLDTWTWNFSTETPSIPIKPAVGCSHQYALQWLYLSTTLLYTVYIASTYPLPTWPLKMALPTPTIRVDVRINKQ